MKEETQVYEYIGQSGTMYTVKPDIAMYAENDNLALLFNRYDKETGGWEPFCVATVNTVSLAYLEAAIDINNNGMQMVDFLKNNGFGKKTPWITQSGRCVYPIFKFDEEKIRHINPKVFAEYQKAYGRENPPLAQQISQAEDKISKAVTGQKAEKAEPHR